MTVPAQPGASANPTEASANPQGASTDSASTPGSTTPGSTTPGTTTRDTTNPTPLITARDLHVHLGAAVVLHGVNLTVNAGEVVAIMGANGSGKSTLIRSLVRIIPHAEGTITTPPPAKIGYVPQRVSAAGGIAATSLEVVASGLLGPGKWRLPRNWKDAALSALTQVDLADRANEATIHLSGGQQQRVLIARALVRNPEVLILDEPVAGVDLPSQQQFAQTLATLIQQGITVLVVLHELGELAPLITRSVVLRHGRVIHDGAPPTPRPGHDAADHQHVHPHAPDAEDPDCHDETGFAGMDHPVAALTEHHTDHHVDHHGDHHAGHQPTGQPSHQPTGHHHEEH
jgi:zinc transport system ATP-binding protein